MGRSINFSYDSIKTMDCNNRVNPQVLDTLRNLNKGDRFVIRKMVGYLEWCPIHEEMSPPLLRAPSNYGYDELPIRPGLTYQVVSENDEPTLETVKGIRSIRFDLADTDKDYFPTYRLMTDGTIRECEGLGILSLIQSIEPII